MFFKYLVAPLLVLLSCSWASAGEFASKKHENAIIVLDDSITGFGQFVFYCSPLPFCNGEQYTVVEEGGVKKKTVTFRYGEGNTIKFWPDGKNYRLDHIKKANGKVTKMTLAPVAHDSQPFPDVTLFNSKWGAKGTHVTVEGDRVEYCYNVEAKNNACGTGKLITVGDRIAIADIGNYYSLLLARFGKDGNKFSVALRHRLNSSWSLGQFGVVDP